MTGQASLRRRRIAVGVAALVPLLAIAPWSIAADPAPRILIAFASYRDRPKHPNIYFYEHDGVATGKIVGMVGGTPAKVADAYGHPTLTHDGKLCACTHEVENQAGHIVFWDLKTQKMVETAPALASPNAQMNPSFAGSGKLLAFSAWNRPGAAQGWRIFLFDAEARKLLDLPGLSGADSDERLPALSEDGRFLAYATNARTGAGLTDVFLFDRQENKVLPLPEMNSKAMDAEPSLSSDGKLVAFTSDREGGVGGRDIYLFDRGAGKLIALPGLNTAGHEYSPALSPDGRYLVFVSERLGGMGERDLYLYDREAGKLLPTPGLNSRADDFDPCILVLRDAR
jgi:Tol biopolymer transport system component